MKKILLLVLTLVPTMMWAGDNDDFGTWLELSAEKALPYNMEIGLEGGLRTKDGSSLMERWDIGASLGYKAHKYLKLATGYSFLHDYTPKKTSKESFDEDGQLESYRLTPSYWSPRHRLFVEASSGIKFWKWLRISARVRYQYTFKPEREVSRTDYERNDQYTPEGPVTTWEEDASTKTYPSEDRHVLRTRIKFSVDKKRLRWSPFISAEFHNNVAAGEHFNFDKLRTSVGTDYKINKHNGIGLSYVMTLNRMDGHPYERMHALSASYSFHF